MKTLIAKSFFTLACLVKPENQMSHADYAARNIWGILVGLIVASLGIYALITSNGIPSELEDLKIFIKTMGGVATAVGGILAFWLILTMVQNIKRHNNEPGIKGILMTDSDTVRQQL